MSKKWLITKWLNKKKKKSVTNQIPLLILSIGSILLIPLFAYLAWFALANKNISHFLPAENTLAYGEVNDLLIHPKLSTSSFASLIPSALSATSGLDSDFFTSLNDRPQGFALLKQASESHDFVFFVRSFRKSRMLEQMKSIGLSGETLSQKKTGKTIFYSYPQSHSFSFVFIGPYLFLSKNIDALQRIQSVYEKKEKALFDDSLFRKTFANLPRSPWCLLYINPLSFSFAVDPAFNQILHPLKAIVDHFGLTIRKESNGFHFNTLLAVKPDLLPESAQASLQDSFSYSLADMISSKDLVGYLGGNHLRGEFQNTLESLSKLNPVYGVIFEGILRSQISKIFGASVSLQDDIYPLFEGEYALALDIPSHTAESDDKLVKPLIVKLLLKHNNQAFAEIKMKKLLDGFTLLAAQFSPQLKMITLPDGTESKEWVADSSRLKTVEENHQGYNIHCLEVEQSAYGFCYSVTDDLVIAANDLNAIRQTIDLTLSPQFSLSQFQPFRKSLNNLSKVSNEMTFIDLNKAIQWSSNRFVRLASDFLTPFESITWIKHQFNDGVSTEGYLLLK